MLEGGGQILRNSLGYVTWKSRVSAVARSFKDSLASAAKIKKLVLFHVGFAVYELHHTNG